MISPVEMDYRHAYHQRRVIVLGSTGFIGRWVARALNLQGANLFLLVRDPAVAEGLFPKYGIKGEICASDLADLERVKKEIEAIQPQVILNLAGYGIDRSERDEAQSYRINAELVAALCEALAGFPAENWHGQRLVHVGSALEYGEIHGNLNENSAPFPTTLYGKSKLAGTLKLSACCQALGLPGITARLFTVYGPGEHPTRLLPSLLQAATDGEDLPLTAGEQERDFTYVEDVAEGLLRLGAARSKPGDIVNLATGVLTSVKSFVLSAAEVLGIPSGRLKFGALPSRMEEMEHEPVSIEKLRKILGWKPETTIPLGIRKTSSFLSTF